MISFSLQSGSNGNCIYVEAGDTRLLIDAGISGKQAEGRMRLRDRDIRAVDALLISHDHNDHVRCAGVFHRKFGLPIYMSRRTQAALKNDLGNCGRIRYFTAGDPITIGDVTVHTLPTPHDAADGVAFVIEHERRRLGVLTDLGHPFAQLKSLVRELDGMYLESNYDPEMLSCGGYPWYLQERIRGGAGHLSNAESAGLLKTAGQKLKWVVLSHLSENNNEPDLALDTHHQIAGQYQPLTCASRYQVGEIMEL